MASGYKLRLGDGTTVLVDDKGLATWLQGGLVDANARVQPAGSKQWLTIRQLLVAVERATRERQVEQERRTARQRVEEERAEAERRSAEEQAEAERRSTEERAEAEHRAAEEQAALQRLTEERLVAERRAAEEQAARQSRAEQERLAAERRSTEERAEAERRAVEERAALERLAEKRLVAERRAAEEQAARESRAEQERLAAERRSARERAEAERRAAEERAALDRLAEKRLVAERRAAEEQAAREGRAEQERLAAERRSARERTEAKRRADEERTARARRESEPREAELETLELEPLPEAELEEALPEAELEEPVVSEADLGLVPVEWLDADERAEPLPPPVGREERPLPPAPSFRALEGRATSLFETLRPGLVATAERVRSLARWPRPAAAARPALAAPFGEMPHTLAVPPPLLRDLPVIPLAEIDEPARADEGRDGWLDRLRAAFLDSRAAEIAPRLWVWCKRVTVTAALLVIAALLAFNTSVWLPATTEFGIALFGQVDKLKARVAPSPVPAAEAAAIAAASEQLPHLRTETIELIMASSAHRTLAPPQLFRLAGDAVERGRATLGPSTAAELDRLTEALTAELSRAERTRLGDYLKRVRARAVTAPFEDQEAAWLMARAARRLPAERLSRLQELFARAAALGLQPNASAPGGGSGPAPSQ